MLSLDEAAVAIVVVGLLLIAVVGVFFAWVTALVLGGDQKGFLLDAALGPVAYMVVYAVAVTLRDQASRRAMYPDSYPYPWPFVVAWVLPVLHQIYRHQRQGPR